MSWAIKQKCLRVLIAVKKYDDHDNSYKGKIKYGLLTNSKVQSISIMGSMTAWRQTWCWSRSWGSYVLQATRRRLTEKLSDILSIENLKASSHSDTLLPARPYLLQNVMPINSVTTYGIMGPSNLCELGHGNGPASATWSWRIWK